MSSRSLLAIALKFLLLFSLPSFAYSAETASSADSLLKLHQLRLAAQKSLGDFYMYNGMEGDQRYARMICWRSWISTGTAIKANSRYWPTP